MPFGQSFWVGRIVRKGIEVVTGDPETAKAIGKVAKWGTAIVTHDWHWAALDELVESSAEEFIDNVVDEWAEGAGDEVLDSAVESAGDTLPHVANGVLHFGSQIDTADTVNGMFNWDKLAEVLGSEKAGEIKHFLSEVAEKGDKKALVEAVAQVKERLPENIEKVMDPAFE